MSCCRDDVTAVPRPSVGRIVHYVSKMGDGVISPAVVLRTRQSTIPEVIERWGGGRPSQYLVVEVWVGVVRLIHVRSKQPSRQVAEFELPIGQSRVDAANEIARLVMGGGSPSLAGLSLFVDPAIGSPSEATAMLRLLQGIGAKELPAGDSVSGAARPASLVAELPDDTTVDLLVHGLGGDYREYGVPYSCKGEPRSWIWPARA